MIRVVNVRGLRTPEQRAGIVYVGRPFAGWPGHALANPYRLGLQADSEDVASCLVRYRLYLEALTPGGLTAYLARLWEECGHGAKPLGCWCIDATHGDGQPVVCHAQILAGLLAERFITQGGN